jgi:hypothetical protein
METLIIIANLGRVRPVNFRAAGEDPQDQPHLFEDPASTVDMRPQLIHEMVTDQAGRFTQSGPLDRKAGMSYGEELNLETEIQKQALERIAKKIGEIVAAEGSPPWRLVVPQEIMPRLLRNLSAAAHNALARVEPGDLTKLPLAELEKRFLTVH